MSALDKTMVNLKLKLKSGSKELFYEKWCVEMEFLSSTLEESLSTANEHLYWAAYEEDKNLDLIFDSLQA